MICMLSSSDMAMEIGSERLTSTGENINIPPYNIVVEKSFDLRDSKHTNTANNEIVADLRSALLTSPHASTQTLEGVRTPHPNDVLCGRGSGTSNNPGNELFRDKVNKTKRHYLKSKKRNKPKVAASLVAEIRQQVPPGRFLQKNDDTSLWDDIGDLKAQEKTSQALREGAPEIRNDIKQQLEKDGFPGKSTMGGGGTKKRKKVDDIFGDMPFSYCRQGLQPLPFKTSLPDSVSSSTNVNEIGRLYALATRGHTQVHSLPSLPLGASDLSVSLHRRSGNLSTNEISSKPHLNTSHLNTNHLNTNHLNTSHLNTSILGTSPNQNSNPSTIFSTIEKPSLPLISSGITAPGEGAPQSLKSIKHPNLNDVLCGRGGGTNIHPGNERFRFLVNSKKRPYLKSKKRDKPEIAREIVATIRNLTPSGRFLQKNEVSGDWDDIGDLNAQKKTSQALREGAPDIRNNIKQELEYTKTESSFRYGHFDDMKQEENYLQPRRDQTVCFPNPKWKDLENQELPGNTPVRDLNMKDTNKRDVTGKPGVKRPCNPYFTPVIPSTGKVKPSLLNKPIIMSEVIGPPNDLYGRKIAAQPLCEHKQRLVVNNEQPRQIFNQVGNSSQSSYIDCPPVRPTMFEPGNNDLEKKAVKRPWIFSDLDYEVYELLKNKDKLERKTRKEAAEYQDAALMGCDVNEFETKLLGLPSFMANVKNSHRNFVAPVEVADPEDIKSVDIPDQPVSKDESEVCSSLVFLRKGASTSPTSTCKESSVT